MVYFCLSGKIILYKSLLEKKRKIKSTSNNRVEEVRKSCESVVSMQMGIFLNGTLVFIAFNVRESR